MQTNPVRFSGFVLRNLRSTLVAVGLFSIAGNLLLLTGPLFMLQVYDRILPSGSVPTLTALFGLVCLLYLFYALFDSLRAQLFSRVAFRLDRNLGQTIQRACIRGQVDGKGDTSATMKDLKAVRHFLSAGGPPALFDAPWVVIYLGVIFALHVSLGILAAAGAGLVIALAVLQELASRGPLKAAGRLEGEETDYERQAFTGADAMLTMGMVGHFTANWQTVRDRTMAQAQKALSTGQLLGSGSKATRLLIQSAMLALGALLAIRQEISPGTLIAASILSGRALAPVDQLIANWRGFVRARLAASKLADTFNANAQQQPFSLPEPTGRLAVDGVVKLAPQHGSDRNAMPRPLLQGLNFNLQPGDGLGIIGPSGSGKSCLARLLTGLWAPDRGSVTLDGAPFSAWDRDRLGRHIGYLPQNVQLLSGTIAQNIARFDADAAAEDVVEAAKRAGVHDIILSLPQGYETPVGTTASPLSGGQAQRIALARAIFRKPCLIVLDEPNAHLDAEGEAALANCIRAMRQAGSTVVVVAHRPNAVAAVNKMLVLNEGRQMRFGDKQQVLSDDHSKTGIHVVSG